MADGNSFFSSLRWFQLTAALAVMIIVTFLLLGWCTGDTAKPGISLTISNHANADACFSAAAGLTMTRCVTLMTPALNAWAASQTCTPHGRCQGCRKIATLDTGNASIECISDGRNSLDLVCYNFSYDLDCDCP